MYIDAAIFPPIQGWISDSIETLPSIAQDSPSKD